MPTLATNRASTSKPRKIRDPEFGERLRDAFEAHPHAPKKHGGQLAWLKDRLWERFQIETSKEGVRKWLAGEVRPRHDKIAAIAEILEVDVGLLSTGIQPDLSPRERKVRNAMADGVVNVVAGFIQMDGGHPAFPEDEDPIDIRAIIKGASYAFHVALGEQNGTLLRFPLPTKHKNLFVLGAIRREGFCVDLYELDADMIEQHGTRRGASVEVSVTEAALRTYQITSFRERP